ncbi:condensation domain-containing protein [Photorhabdus asymbiotica]|uniref:condensation domain-containing protein n=1 Tax=Photorhabdus asymbiotica TaxID=291112 RepID=UPI003DA792F2
MYNIPIAKEIIGDFDPIRLISALKKLISCHEILRGIYKMDDDTISIEFREPDAEVYNSCYQDISHLPIEEQEQIITETLAGQCTQPFNLASELPIRCHILKTNKFCHYLFLTFHHCIVDGWTANILVNELNHNYRGDDSICSRSDSKFFQFLEDPFINVSDVDHSLKFWRDELHGAPERHKLPYDITINYDELKTNIIRNSLPCRLTRDLIKTSNREGTSWFTLLHTAFAVLSQEI